MPFRVVTACAFATAALFAASADARGDDATRAVFPYHDADYLRPGESEGGLVFAAEEVPAGGRVPLVVFLHGVNAEGVVHAWAGGRGTPDLLSTVAAMNASSSVRPFLFAAPSQTRFAMAGRTMWQGFDLDAFVDAVDEALDGRATVDRRAVIVTGHSGAACNADGGLLDVATHASRVVPAAIVAIDTCLDEYAGRAFGAAKPQTDVYVTWERDVWARSIPGFLTAFRASARSSRRRDPIVTELTGFHVRPHEEIVERTYVELLPRLPLLAPPVDVEMDDEDAP